jgi:hypothetical protein
MDAHITSTRVNNTRYNLPIVAHQPKIKSHFSKGLEDGAGID